MDCPMKDKTFASVVVELADGVSEAELRVGRQARLVN